MSDLAVFRPARFARLLAADAMNVGRDPVLMFAIAMSVLPVIGFAFWRVDLDAAAQAAFGIESFSRFVVPIALVLPSVLVGWVTGFLLIEDRDDGLSPAFEVTPIGRRGFYIYRVSVTALLAAALTLAGMPVLIPGASWPMTLLLAGLIGLEAVAAAVILPVFARNKVEGLALTKLTNIATVIPLVALVPSPLRYAAGLFPSYWIGELTGLAPEPALPPLVAILVAIAVHLAAAALVLHAAGRRARR